jgi:DHA2 family metal-tetracycline-proton antiporter-like MFS transporter
VGRIGSPALGGASLFGVSGNASSYANLLLICGAVVLLGLVVFLVFRRHIYAANR